MATSKILYLPRADSYVKKTVRNHSLNINKVGHDGDLSVLEFDVPKRFDLEKFYHDLRDGNKDVR